jgi:HEAT repeat protein
MLWWNLKQLKSGDYGARIRAAEALGKSKDTAAAVPALIQCLCEPYDKYDKVRMAAAEALGELGVDAAGPLLPVLRHKIPGVRAAAARALGKTRDRGAVPSLDPMLADPDPVVRVEVAGALQKLGWATTADQRALLHVIQGHFMAAAAEGVAAIPPLLAMLDCVKGDDDWQFVLNVQEALEEIGTDAVPSLVQALGHPSATVRGGCAKVLGQICDQRTEEVLITLAENDPDKDVRWAAEEALKLLARGQSGKERRAKALEMQTGIRRVDLEHERG